MTHNYTKIMQVDALPVKIRNLVEIMFVNICGGNYQSIKLHSACFLMNPIPMTLSLHVSYVSGVKNNIMIIGTIRDCSKETFGKVYYHDYFSCSLNGKT